MKLRLEPPKEMDIDLLLKFDNQLSLDEGILQFPNISKKEMKQHIKKSEKKQKEYFRKHLKDKKHNIFFLALVDNKKVGYIQGEIKTSKGRIERIFVKKEYRKKGIAQKLFKKIEKEFKRRNINKICSNIFYGNFPSKKFHEILGFKPSSIEYIKKFDSVSE